MEAMGRLNKGMNQDQYTASVTLFMQSINSDWSKVSLSSTATSLIPIFIFTVGQKTQGSIWLPRNTDTFFLYILDMWIYADK